MRLVNLSKYISESIKVTLLCNYTEQNFNVNMPHNRRPVPVSDGSETTYPMPFSFVLASFAFPLIPSCFIVVFQEPNIMTEFVYFPFLEIVSIDAFMGLRLTLTGGIHTNIYKCMCTCVFMYILVYKRLHLSWVSWEHYEHVLYTLLLIFYVGRQLIKLSNLG